LKLGVEEYSPAMLQKIEYAGGNNRSFETAAASLERLAECPVNARQVERITERLGKERADARDKSAAAMEARKLRSRFKEAPAVAVISVDAGKAQFREQDKGPGVHTPRCRPTRMPGTPVIRSPIRPLRLSIRRESSGCAGRWPRCAGATSRTNQAAANHRKTNHRAAKNNSRR